MIVVNLRADDFDSNGFVFVGGIVEAILDATEKKNVVKTRVLRYHPCLIDPDSLPSDVQAGTIVEDIIERHSILSERKIFSEINRAIVAGDLTAYGRNGIGMCAKEDIPLGIVTFPELAAWGQKVGIYQFRRAGADSGSKDGAVKVGANETTPSERQAATITTHRLKARSNMLDAVIELATGTALAPDNNQSVWAELVKLAESKDRPAPLIGYSSDGIQYRGKKYQESGEPDTFTLNNLRDRMTRAKKR